MSNKALVLKFGGTSLGTTYRIIKVARIIQEKAKNQRIVVIVSAISSSVKSQGTTSLLLQSAQAAAQKGDYHQYLSEIKLQHLEISKGALKDESLQKATTAKLIAELDQLKELLAAVAVIGELSAVSSDMIIATGEKLSAILLSSVLQDIGVPGQYVNLQQVVKKDFHNVNREFRELLQGNIAQELAAVSEKVAVLTGFIGKVPRGILQGVGRGYTDFTAASVAACLEAKELQIWKDVAGVYSADPNKVNNAYVVDCLTPEEAAELTYYGSEVIHPFTIEQVVKANIPVRIKNTFNPNSPGTAISSICHDQKAANKPTSVTIKRHIQVINIKSNRMLMSHGFMARVFNIFEKYQVVIDLISTSEVSISLTTEPQANVMNAALELKKIAEVSIEKDMAILSLVGRGMDQSIGTAAKMFQTLADSGINIEMITQGASEINISCVIKDSDALLALQAVHEQMLA